jgi:hypothetical protein
MMPNGLQPLAIASLWLGGLSALVILADILTGHRQRMMVMNVVWPISGLYFGPLGLWAYYAMGRQSAHAGMEKMRRHEGHQHPRPRPPMQRSSHGGHDEHQGDGKPFWQKAFVGTTHCGAGCTLGDVIGEFGIFATGLILFNSKLATAYAVDFALAYLIGVVFQYFSIAPMRHLGLWEGLKAAVKADTISLVAFEVGMFAWMALTRLVFFHPAPEPNAALFWFMMQIAMVVGFATSFPANWFLIKAGLKEAM